MTRCTTAAYIERKDALLTDCLRLTEDIYSALDRPESLPALLDRRMELLRALFRLDEEAGEAKAACPEDENKRLTAKLRLIQSLDARIETALGAARSELLNTMKRNATERKFTGYAPVTDSGKGRRLDEKK
ncbi:MAG: hypothetical protein LBD95_01605 [Clostridiales Family XIII bacterium]|jgi:hypothetical protein|nr:hypothetical protein [Clostridiales Family XIII bacterium]